MRNRAYVYDILIKRADIALCHALHYLQMACEKTAKASLLHYGRNSLDDLRTKHAFCERFVKEFFNSPQAMTSLYKELPSGIERRKSIFRGFAKAIDRLHPSVEAETYLQNVEYPWETSGKVYMPYEEQFNALPMGDAKQPDYSAFVPFVNLMKTAAKEASI